MVIYLELCYFTEPRAEVIYYVGASGTLGLVV
jgi:hypothetical protein